MRIAVLAPLVLVASCTFPDVQFGDASTPIDSGSDVVVTNDAGNDAPFNVCDKDKDGYIDKYDGCGGNDCNDNDPRANPGVKSYVYDEPDGEPYGDWNCDGTAQPEYSVVTCGATTCGSKGYTTSTGCGITNLLVVCSPSPLCPASDAGLQPQGCL